MKILFFGEKPIGEAIFKLLLGQNNFEILAVVTNFETDNWWATNEIYHWAVKQESVLNFSSKNKLVSSDIKRLLQLNFDTILSLQYGWHIPEVLVKKARLALNLHMAPLPKYRGHHPFFHAIFENEKIYGVSLHEIANTFDSGNIVAQKLFPVSANETAYSLYTKSLNASLTMFKSFILALSSGTKINGLPQAKTNNFYDKNLLGQIAARPDLNEEEMVRLKRALYFPPICDIL